jgi:GNAT superfamily N-acetyltransferase
VNVQLREACIEDFEFARALYFETMRWVIERLFGWDQAREEDNFEQFFKLDEVRVIQSDGRDAGWFQERLTAEAIYLGSLYIAPAMQRRGIGTQILRGVLERAASQSKAVTLAVVKINPALHFYEKHGFRITGEDRHKFYLRAEP